MTVEAPSAPQVSVCAPCSAAALRAALEAAKGPVLLWPGRRRPGGVGRTGARRLYVFAPPVAMEPVRALLSAHALHHIACRFPSAETRLGRVSDTEEWYGADTDTASLLHVRLQPASLPGNLPDCVTAFAVNGLDVSAHRRHVAALLAWCDAALRADGTAEPPRTEADLRATIELAGRELGAAVAEALGNAFDGADLASLRRALHARHEGNSSTPPAPRTRSPSPVPAPRPAPVIAVIGCDGSGKSTMSRWLAAELDEPFGTRFIYFGTGDGPGSIVRRALGWLKRHSRFSPDRPGDTARERSTTPRRGVEEVPVALRLIWAGVVAHERLGKMRTLRRATRAGLTVVTDRYPQTEHTGIHDGPRLPRPDDRPATGSGATPPRRLGIFSRGEHALYVRLARRVPDRVLLLDVPVEIAARRRPEERRSMLERRIDIARRLEFGGARRTVIDASLPLPAVKLAALHHALETLAT